MSARLGRYDLYINNPLTGLPIAGVTVEVRRLGATIVSGGATVFTIDNPGAIRFNGEVGAPATDSLMLYGSDGAVKDEAAKAVTALAATSLTIAGPGFSGTVNNDRLSPSTNLPTVFADDEGDEAIANPGTVGTPLYTDANGHAYFFAKNGAYDVRVSGGGITIRLLMGQPVLGGASFISNVFTTGTQPAYDFDTLRALAAGDFLARFLVQGVAKATIDKDGKLTLSGALSATGNSTIVGTLTGLTGITTSGGIVVTSSGITVTGNSTITGTLTVTSDLTMRRLIASQGTDAVVGDFVLSAGWGTTATLTILNPSKDTRGMIAVNCTGAGQAANPTIAYTYKNGAYATTPFVVTHRVRNGALTQQLTVPFTSSSTVTVCTFTFEGTPVVNDAIGMSWHILD